MRSRSIRPSAGHRFESYLEPILPGSANGFGGIGRPRARIVGCDCDRKRKKKTSNTDLDDQRSSSKHPKDGRTPARSRACRRHGAFG